MSHRSRSKSRSSSSESWNSLGPLDWSRLVVDVCLAATFLVAPLCMGGREPLGQLVLTLLAGVAALAWSIHQLRTPQPAWRFTGAELLMVLGIGLVVFQIVPISQSLLGKISPKLPELIPLLWGEVDPALQLPLWQTVSLAPYSTGSHVATLLACVMLYFTLVQRVANWSDVEQLVRLIVTGSVLMAAFGLLQFALGNGKYFWFYQHPQASTKFAAVGGFTNANHFANFLAMSIPLQFWLLIRIQQSVVPKHQRHHHNQEWQYREVGGIRMPAWVIMGGMAITGLAILLSMSRGGIAVTSVGMGILLLLYWRKSLLTTQLGALLGLAVVAGVVGTAMFGDLAGKMIEQNFVELTSQEWDQLDSGELRRRVWQANVAGIKEFPVLGTGLGTHADVYKLWYDYPENGKVASHAENGYLQIALETGLSGLIVVSLLWLIAILWCLRLYWGSNSTEIAALGGAILAALLISLIHSLTDFVWYAPACVMVVLALGVIAARCCHLPSDTNSADPEMPAIPLWSPMRLAWCVTLPGIVVLTVMLGQMKWQETVAFSRAYSHRMLTESLLAESQAKDSSPEEMLKLHKLQIRAALDCIAADPHAHLQQMRAGLAYSKLFLLAQQERDDSMPLVHLQDAARASGFTPEELDTWLDKPGVLGDNRIPLRESMAHYRESIRLCPIQGRSYIELASMIWTEGATADQELAMVDQALDVRPYDSTVLFAYAYRMAERGGLEGALPYLQQGFRNGPEARESLMDAFSKSVPAAFFLDNFEMDRGSLTQLEKAYREAPDRYGYSKVLEKLAESSVQFALETDGLKAEEAWLQAHDCFVKLDDRKKAYRCGMAALEVNPSSYNAHQTLGLWLYQEQKYAAAAEHLIWCHRRRPAVEWIRTLSENALAQSHSVGSAASPPPVLSVQEIQQTSGVMLP